MVRSTRDPQSRLPLKPATYQVLLALGDQPQHGYAIMQAVSTITDGQERILPGTLYAALARMVDDGLVEESTPRGSHASGGPPRRYYRRTALGREVARAESERLRALLDVAVSQNILRERRP